MEGSENVNITKHAYTRTSYSLSYYELKSSRNSAHWARDHTQTVLKIWVACSDLQVKIAHV